MEADSMNLQSIIEEEEEEEEKEASTVGSDKRRWNQSIQEMKDKENVCKYPRHNSDMSASQSKKTTKKKGFNLRKSLAWNPAFLTEEGVLDPTELSFLSGSHGESNRSETPGNRHILHEAAVNSFSKSRMKSELRSHNGRKLFTTPEPSRRQEKKPPEGTRKLIPGGPSTKILLRPPTTSQQKRVANMTATGHVPKVQKLIQGSITPTSQISSNKKSVLRAVKGENSIGPKCLQSNQKKETVSLPKSSTGAENSAASQSRTIPKAPMNAPAFVKPSGLRKPSPSFGFFAQGQIPAQSGSGSQTTTEKTLTTVPSSIPKPPTFKRRYGHDCAEKHMTGAFPQSKIPQIMRFDQTTVNITGKMCTKKSTRTSKEPREKLVAPQLACNRISAEACSTKDPDADICKSKDTSFTEKTTTVSVEVKEPAMTQLTWNLVQSKAFNHMDGHVTLAQQTIAMSSDNSSKKNQYNNSDKVAAQAMKQAAQYTSNSISIEACSSMDGNAVVSKSDDADLNVNTSGVKHVEENRICEGRETVSTCVPMDVDVIISKPNDDNSKVSTNGMKHTQHSKMGCEGQKEEAAVIATTCSRIPPETYSSKDKLIMRHKSSVNDLSQGDISNVSVSPLKTQRGKSDFSPCKEKLLEKTFKSDSGSSLTIRGHESYKNENPGAGKVEENIADSSEGKNIPNFQKDLVPFSEEWLAALEAYGEEILEKKTGPVQNSPPDKTIPEPSPWSPVKKKVQDIGPYDCTKYSKTAPPSDAQ